ncbi:MAG: hypothetical protein COA42_09490 [Alteromonadaceae bacterium]|nr:MAG: hypothetical protein COA42_09490 [Alteromonadaceae bacterium]
MSLVCSTHFSLVRARRELERAQRCGDWQSVRNWDVTLASNLNDAFEDKDRNTPALIKELERILRTYSELVDKMPDSLANGLFLPK